MTEPQPLDPMNYDEYNPDDFTPIPQPKEHHIGADPYEPTRAELMKSHLRVAASNAILSPVGRVAFPDISTRVRLANNVLNGDKIKAQKAAKQARQAFPESSRQPSTEATMEVTGHGLGPKGMLHENSTAPAGLDPNADLGR